MVIALHFLLTTAPLLVRREGLARRGGGGGGGPLVLDQYMASQACLIQPNSKGIYMTFSL